MKALARKRGRPKKPGVTRTESGRISQAKNSEDRLLLEAATWRRRRNNPGMTIEEARQQEHGSVIHSWRIASQRAEKQAPETAHAHIFTAQHLATAERLHKLYLAYRLAIAAKSMRSSTDYSGAGGYDGADPFESETARRDARAIASYKTARRAILESCPLGMMAVEAVIYENQSIPERLGDLRMALNAVERHWSTARAA